MLTSIVAIRSDDYDWSSNEMASLGKFPSSLLVGLGSNLGDREANLREAVDRIAALGPRIAQRSSVYETEPVGYADQGWFLNQAIEVAPDALNRAAFEELSRADKGPDPPHFDQIDLELLRDKKWVESGQPEFATLWILCFLAASQVIELVMGRKRTIRYGPRVIDIDLLLFGEVSGFFATTRGSANTPGLRVAGDPFLTIPHPRMHLRRFVLEPLCEIAPEALHPVLNKTVRQLLAELQDNSVVRRLES
jgi:2-amino-4-hydroxy-6-hydroxymethyldihydropteridine diphosphokinase